VTSARDIRIPVQVTAEEYLAFRVVAEDAGQSLSGMARNLIRTAIAAYAHRSADGDGVTSAKPGQQ
jgi:hypothetical protein